jgi:hypothetical protein
MIKTTKIRIFKDKKLGKKNKIREKYAKRRDDSKNYK